MYTNDDFEVMERRKAGQALWCSCVLLALFMLIVTLLANMMLVFLTPGQAIGGGVFVLALIFAVPECTKAMNETEKRMIEMREHNELLKSKED